MIKQGYSRLWAYILATLRGHLKYVGTLLFVCVLVFPAIADEEHLALVVGNRSYPELGSLPYATTNAEQVSRALTEVGFTSLHSDESVLPTIDLDREGLATAMFSFSEAMGAAPDGSVGFLYFAGHGIARERRGDVYIMPTDATLKPGVRLDQVGLPVADIIQLLKAHKNKTVVLVFDACRNVIPEHVLEAAKNTVVVESDVAGGGWGTKTRQVGLLQRGFRRDSSVFTKDRADYFVAFSTSPGRVAYDTDIFSSILAEEIQRGHHDVLSLFKTVGERVAIESRQSGDLQLPTFEVSLYKDPPCFGSCRGASQDVDAFFECSGCPWVKALPGGAFRFGSPKSEKSRGKDEPVSHTVNAGPVGIGLYEVTRAEWLACERAGACAELLDKNEWQSSKAPVGGVTLNDAMDYVAWLNLESGASYRLPTEAEWEYAARSGQETPFMTGNAIEPSQASFDYSASYNGSRRAEYRGAAETVGSFEPNEFGLYDMHGNMWEWACARVVGTDCIEPVLRGGSYKTSPADLRFANRMEIKPTKRREDVGFRILKVIE